MTHDLAHCPFCGKSDAKLDYVRDGYRVRCRCGAAGPCEFHGPLTMPPSHERAATRWNERRQPETTYD